MNTTMRKIGVLCQKDLIDLFKNPSMMICLVLPIGFAVLYRFMMGDAQASMSAGTVGDAAANELSAVLSSFQMSSALCISIGMVVGMVIVYGIAEEKEKHTLRTLMLANVSAGQIIASRALVSMVATLAVAAVCFFVIGVDGTSLLPMYLALCVLGALPIVLLSLVLGLAARDQMTAGLYSVPIILIAMAPMFGMYDEAISNVVKWLPTGGMNSLVDLMVRGQLFTNDALLPLSVTLVWIVAGVVIFALLFKRLVRDN